MKMLTRDSDNKNLASLKERLENSGIPAVIQGKETARMTVSWFLLEPTLWIYLDHQFEDAIRLMDNPDHVVTTGIDIEQFYSSALSNSAQKKALNEGLKQIAIYVSALIFGMFILVRILDKIAS